MEIILICFQQRNGWLRDDPVAEYKHIQDRSKDDLTRLKYQLIDFRHLPSDGPGLHSDRNDLIRDDPFIRVGIR